jgi:hypothetical protein
MLSGLELMLESTLEMGLRFEAVLGCEVVGSEWELSSEVSMGSKIISVMGECSEELRSKLVLGPGMVLECKMAVVFKVVAG